MLSKPDMIQFERHESDYYFVGLRHDDIQEIRKWRNAQQDVLRQQRPITREGQEQWWENVVVPMRMRSNPEFLLVSILDIGRKLIGYGGLTYIDWHDRQAEISFLVSPVRAVDPILYEKDLLAFWRFLQNWAFKELGLQRLVTETYDFRHAHIALLEKAGMTLEGRTRNSVKVDNGYADSLLHELTATDKNKRA